LEKCVDNVVLLAMVNFFQVDNIFNFEEKKTVLIAELVKLMSSYISPVVGDTLFIST
jgi:hypothetical protein